MACPKRKLNIMSKNVCVRVERGSFRRREEHKHSENKQILTPPINPHNDLLLLSSSTTLCQEPLIDANTSLFSSEKHRNTEQNVKNINFFSKTNMSIYEKKFQKLSNLYNKTRNRNKNPKTIDNNYKLYLNKLLQKQIEFHKLIIFDFDDTLFPTSSIPQTQLKSFDSNPLFYGETKQLYYNLQSLIDIIISLFNSIKAQSSQTDIYIVTNASFGWISGIFDGYFSGVIGRLFDKLATNIKQNNIRIISARDEYLNNISNRNKLYFDGEIAKTDCMQNIFEMYTKNNKKVFDKVLVKVPIIYCIGDGLDEFNASKIAWNNVIGDKYVSILQRIKFIEKPSIELLMKEIQTIESLINDDTNKQFIEWIINKKYIIDYV